MTRARHTGHAFLGMRWPSGWSLPFLLVYTYLSGRRLREVQIDLDSDETEPIHAVRLDALAATCAGLTHCDPARTYYFVHRYFVYAQKYGSLTHKIRTAAVWSLVIGSVIGEKSAGSKILTHLNEVIARLQRPEPSLQTLVSISEATLLTWSMDFGVALDKFEKALNEIGSRNIADSISRFLAIMNWACLHWWMGTWRILRDRLPRILTTLERSGDALIGFYMTAAKASVLSILSDERVTLTQLKESLRALPAKDGFGAWRSSQALPQRAAPELGALKHYTQRPALEMCLGRLGARVGVLLRLSLGALFGALLGNFLDAKLPGVAGIMVGSVPRKLGWEPGWDPG